MKKIRSIIFPLALHILSLQWVSAQEARSITGRIVDKATEAPIPFAQVSIINSSIGIITNTDGYFELSISSFTPGDSAEVYSFGYERANFKLGDWITGGKVIKLNPAVFKLREVEILGMTVEDVLRHAVAGIPDNYGKEPLLLTSFVRVRKMVANKLAEYTEAVVKDQKDGYYLYPKKKLAGKHNKSNVPEMMKGRVVSDTLMVNSLGDIGKNAFCMSCLFSKDLVEFYQGTVLDEKEFRFYDYHMEEIMDPTGKKLYHIIFDQKDKVKQSLWKGDIYINASDFAIEKIILKPSLKGFDRYNTKTKYQRIFTIRNIPGWIEEMPLGQTVLTYSNRQGGWYLNTIRNEYWMTYVHPPTGQHLKYGYLDELVVTDVTRDPDSIRNFKGSKSIAPNQRWDQLVGKEDEDFWKNYNYLPIEESLKEAIRSLVIGH
ncbi:MAG: carboxypeptidase-like regulatory domain-containing protein [Bacteroidetes bacterium]|nr:carboxypeptidase-like regulatory domain-containing protein [Bacteroidota bacterium]